MGRRLMVVAWTCVRWGSGLCGDVSILDHPVEYHGLLVDVELGRESFYLALNGVPCIFMHRLEVVDSGTRVHVCALLEW